MVVIGGIIGSGIFINPYIVAQRLDSSALVLAAWVAGGAIALAGAFAYGSALFPRRAASTLLREGSPARWIPLWMSVARRSGGAIAVAITLPSTLRLVGRPEAGAVPLASAPSALSVINYLSVSPAAACSTCSSC
jgi:APA family basic amino acid/polyamine antiporter